MMSDLVKEPSHYTRFKIQPQEFMIENELPNHVASIVKYSCRAGHKIYEGLDAGQSEIIDLQKGIRWAEKRIEKIKRDRGGD